MNFNEVQKQPNEWSCLPTAFAMAFRIPVAEVFERIGHDGSRLDGEGKETGFHNQELVDLAFDLGYHVITVEAGPTLGDNEFKYLTNDKYYDRMTKYLETYSGIIEGYCGNQRHAIYWENGSAVNPCDGVVIHNLEFIQILRFFIVEPINQCRNKWLNIGQEELEHEIHQI